jgi:hypothetical protein
LFDRSTSKRASLFRLERREWRMNGTRPLKRFMLLASFCQNSLRWNFLLTTEPRRNRERQISGVRVNLPLTRHAANFPLVAVVSISFLLVLLNLLHAPAHCLTEGRATSIDLAQAGIAAGFGDGRQAINALY